MRVLVVDDHPVNRTLVQVLLADTGSVVSQAENGAVALRKIEEEKFDAVLLDISMPDISGKDICAWIKSRPSLNGMQVIAYTAHALDSERQELLAGGFDGVLIKPISRDSLLAALDIH
jgi:CheY-like chemotaxis protein